jgi:predicted nucleic acid-binding protein
VTIVVDTSVLIDVLRGLEEARSALEAAVRSEEQVIGSVLTRLEVRAGVRPGEEESTERLLAAIDWVSVDEELADDAGRLAAQYLRAHPGTDTVEYVIAATAMALNAAVWTRNVRYFPMFGGLAAPY